MNTRNLRYETLVRLVISGEREKVYETIDTTLLRLQASYDDGTIQNEEYQSMQRGIIMFRDAYRRRMDK